MNQPVNKPAPLGRGLSALFGDVDASFAPKNGGATIGAQGTTSATTGGGPLPQRNGAPLHLPVTWVQAGAYQPRRNFDQEALQGLAQSIAERGVLEPLLVRPLTNTKDRYEIIAGERRWRAAQMAGLHEVPVIVRHLTDREALEFGLIENIQRHDLSPLEEAEGYHRLVQEFSHTQEELAKIVGKSRPHVANMLRLLALPDGVKRMIDQGSLTLGHARALLPTRDPMALAQEIVAKGLNVRQAESLAKKHNDNPEIHRKKSSAADADVMALEKELERIIGLKVTIHTKGKSGSLTLHYTDLDQLDDIIRRLREG